MGILFYGAPSVRIKKAPLYGGGKNDTIRKSAADKREKRNTAFAEHQAKMTANKNKDYGIRKVDGRESTEEARKIDKTKSYRYFSEV